MAVTSFPTIAGQTATVHLPSWQAKSAAGLRICLCFHGYGGNANHIMQSSGSGGGAFGTHPVYLADRGFVVAAVSYQNSFLDSTAMTDVTALYSYVTGTLGATGKAALFGWSMGAGTALRWYVENPTLVSCLYLNSPLTDLDWAQQQSAFAAEVNADYNNQYSTTGSSRSPMNTLAAFRGGPAIRIVHPTDDATLPYSQSTAFVAAVNDPNVAMRAPDITGGHQGGLLNITARESWEWIRTNAS